MVGAGGRKRDLCVLDLREVGKPAGPPWRRGNHDCVLDDPAPLLLLLNRKRNKVSDKRLARRWSGQTEEAGSAAGITMGEGVLGAAMMAAERWRRLSASILRLFSSTVRSRAASYADIPGFAAASISLDLSASMKCQLCRTWRGEWIGSSTAAGFGRVLEGEGTAASGF